MHRRITLFNSPVSIWGLSSLLFPSMSRVSSSNKCFNFILLSSSSVCSLKASRLKAVCWKKFGKWDLPFDNEVLLAYEKIFELSAVVRGAFFSVKISLIKKEVTLWSLPLPLQLIVASTFQFFVLCLRLKTLESVVVCVSLLTVSDTIFYFPFMITLLENSNILKLIQCKACSFF